MALFTKNRGIIAFFKESRLIYLWGGRACGRYALFFSASYFPKASKRKECSLFLRIHVFSVYLQNYSMDEPKLYP